ncbi:hypothetical protein [Paenibacillus rubinfantis]|uniref:hypothetical protein n=1 Tax=Paenibacillus rubinfantis TaxID=1720296 RepID=UPI00073F5BE2|nr:hypothetical protein [Paenibacillus rubinfantis]
MAQEVMFSPQSNSPVTELAAEITSSDNVVIVVAGNLLPAAPNVVTLGLDELAETIYYATKNGNELSGVVRGYDGTSAKGWSTGTRVARYLTAQDISALQHNISDHETRISGITSETINKITPKLVDDLPALYPIGLSVFSLSLAASDPWKTAIGYPGSGHSTLVQTSKANDSQYSIIQRVTFSSDLGIEAMFERSSTANNSWNGAWIKVVSRGEFDQFKNEVDAHLADYIRQPGFATTGGTSTAYTVTLDPAPATLPGGFGITIVPHVANGANPTLKIGNFTALPLKDQKGNAYAAGKLLAGKPYAFRKVGSDFLADSGSGVEGDATANDLRLGKTATVGSGDVITGTLDLTNLLPSNIKKDISIDGVVGTLEPSNPQQNDQQVLMPANSSVTITPQIGKIVVAIVFGDNVPAIRFLTGYQQSGQYISIISMSGASFVIRSTLTFSSNFRAVSLGI